MLCKDLRLRFVWLLLCWGGAFSSEVPASNVTATTTWLLGLEVTTGVPDFEGNSSLCEGENGTNATNVTRCGGKHEKKSKTWTVRMIWMEWTFNWMALISYNTSIGALICGATQIVLAGISALLSYFGVTGVLSCFMLILEVNVGSFFGLIYIGYLVTIPLFGRPRDFFSPELPHVGPPRTRELNEYPKDRVFEAFKIKTIFAVRNSIFLAFVLYMLMMSIMVFLGSVLVMPIVCFFMGILVGLTRLADSVVRMLADDLDHDFRSDEVQSAMATNLGAATDKSHDVEKQANETRMLKQIGGFITIPWWDDVTKKYFEELNGDGWLTIWDNVGSCAVACGGVFAVAFSVLADSLELLLTVGIPSFLKFNCDILFLMTVLGNFAITIPSFHFKLPNLGISHLLPTFSLFDIDIDLPPLPSSPYPEWEGHCRATTALGLILNLLGSTFTATVVISSDILSCLYDRQSRIKLLKAAQSQMDNAHEKDQEKKLNKKKSWFQRTKDKISNWQTWKNTVKASFYTGLVEVSTFAVLFSIGLIVNQATVFLVQLILEIGAPNSNDGKVPPGYPACTDGVFGLSKILAMIAVILTLSYAYRVLSGHVHKDGIYILGAALVQEETILQLVSLKRLVAIVRVSSFAFLLPFLSVGLYKMHMEMIAKRLGEKQSLLEDLIKTKDEDGLKQEENNLAWRAQRLTQLKKAQDAGTSKNHSPQMTQGGTSPDVDIEQGQNELKTELDERDQCSTLSENESAKRSRDGSAEGEDAITADKITAVKRNFAARSAMTESLFDLALNERGKEKKILLDREEGHGVDLRSVNDFHLFEFTECCKNMEDKRESSCDPFLAMLGAPFARMSNSDAIANRMPERCCIWQAQAESVHKASSYVHGIVLFLIPVAGTVAGKGLQVLSDVPGLFSAKEKEICSYSFYQEPNEADDEPQLVPSVWRKAAYLLGFLRVFCSILTISLRQTEVFWAMSISNIVLASGQAVLQKMDDRRNKANIARIYSKKQNQGQKAELSPQKLGCSDDQHQIESGSTPENRVTLDQDDLESHPAKEPQEEPPPDAPLDFKSDEEKEKPADEESPQPTKEKKKKSTRKSKAKARAKSKVAGANDI